MRHDLEIDLDDDAAAAAAAARRRARRGADRLLVRTAGAARGWWVVLTIDTLAVVVLGIAGPAIVAAAVDATVRDTPHRRAALVALAVLAVLGVLTAATGQLAEAYGVTRADAWLRRGVVRRVLALGVAGEARFGAGDVVSRLSSATPQAASTVPKIIDTAAGLLVAGGAVVALVLIDWRIVVVIALALPFAIVVVRVLMRETAVSTVDYQVAQSDLANRFVDALHGSRTIRACATLDLEITRVSAPLPALQDAGQRMWRSIGRSAGRAGLIAPIVGVAALAVAGQGLAAGRLSPGQLIAASAYVPVALGLFDHLSGLGSIAVDRASAARLAEILAVRPLPAGRRRLGPGSGALTLRAVTVRAGSQRLLTAVDLDVPAGATVAVVGRSGAGKSTLALVAGGLVHPDDGDVLLDGEPLGGLDALDRRDAIAFAFDVPHLVGSTVADALGYGLGAANRADLHRALERAQATGFVARLPGGLDAELAGAPFSGGERQRLGLARALVRRPRLLILDDATSSLDTVTEARVQDAIATAAGESTTIVVAHRIATAARADLVAWLDGGVLRRVGAHADLWHDPAYRAVFAEEVEDLADGGLGADASDVQVVDFAHRGIAS